MYIRSIFNTTMWLLWRDVSILRKGILTTLFDSLIMPCSLIIIGGYILPYMGMPESYGSFMVVGSILVMVLLFFTVSISFVFLVLSILNTLFVLGIWVLLWKKGLL